MAKKKTGARRSTAPKYIVRHYDGFDNEWIDVSKAVPLEKAEEILNKKTFGGTRNASYGDIDYYRIFPADTFMVHSEKGRKVFNG